MGLTCGCQVYSENFQHPFYNSCPRTESSVYFRAKMLLSFTMSYHLHFISID